MTPSPLAQIVTVAGYEIRKYIRGRRLLGMLILLGLIVGLFIGPIILAVAWELAAAWIREGQASAASAEAEKVAAEGQA